MAWKKRANGTWSLWEWVEDGNGWAVIFWIVVILFVVSRCS